ncbi:MAG TPA: alcohol dehydrogenase catalytic domain-containing protein, partial [Candidatus Obscuribacter sp.]|nr:alcohol dehydrogenase catalytic domain-containing protein [Candidatus Obscuribacter sp.]
MRAVTITTSGNPDVLQIAERPEVKPETWEVLVKVEAFGINRADVLQRKGLYPPPPGVPADIPGLEFAGIVEAVGKAVSLFRPGDRVFGLVGGGSYQ